MGAIRVGDFQDNDVKVSVVIPVYNMEKYIGQCLNSILHQTLKEIEIICVDDGSIDDSMEIMKRFSAEYANIYIYSQMHQFAGAARNLGISKAKGEFIAFMDPDDYYETDDALEYLYAKAKQRQVLICGGSMIVYDANTDTEYRSSNQVYVFERDEVRTFSVTPLCFGYTRFLFNRLFLLQRHIFFPDYARFQDPPFFCRALSLAEKYYVCKHAVYHTRYIDKPHKFSSDAVKGIVQGVADVLEYLDEDNEEYRALYMEILTQTLARCVKFLYKWVYESWPELDAMKMLIRIRKTMRRKEAFDALEWDYNCDLTTKWVLKKYWDTKDSQEARMRRVVEANKIVIYGAGVIAGVVMKYVQTVCKKNISFFVVSSKENNPPQMHGVPVYEAGMIAYEEDTLYIVAMDEKWHDDVRQTLKRIGAKDCLYYGKRILPTLWSDIFYGCI